MKTARAAQPLEYRDAAAAQSQSTAPPCRIGVAYDEAFHFYYEYNLALLEAAGVEVVRWSPVHDRVLPQVDGLYFGGGYPEVAARALSANDSDT